MTSLTKDLIENTVKYKRGGKTSVKMRKLNRVNLNGTIRTILKGSLRTLFTFIFSRLKLASPSYKICKWHGYTIQAFKYDFTTLKLQRFEDQPHYLEVKRTKSLCT